jgi:6-phosphofructokinase 1
VGYKGTQALLEGETDKMVTLVRHNDTGYHCETALTPLEKIANVQRLLPDEYLDASKTMVNQAFIDYALPLIGEELPHHTRLI